MLRKEDQPVETRTLSREVEVRNAHGVHGKPCGLILLALRNIDAEVWFEKGMAFDAIGRYKNALECYNRTIELNPNDYYAWLNKGTIYFEIDELEESVVCYNKAIEIDPVNMLAWYNKAVTLDSLGKKKEAKKYYNKADSLKYNLINQ